MTNDFTINTLRLTSDNSYALAGTEGNAFWFGKTDSDGNLLWNQTYYYTDSPHISQFSIHSITPTKDSGYILGGSDGTYAWIVKTDSKGNEQWHNRYDYKRILSIIQTDDGSFVVFGDAQLAKIDGLGKVQWSEFYNSSDNAPASGVQELAPSARAAITTKDGGFVVAGSTSNDQNSYTLIWAAKFKSESSASVSPSVPEFSTVQVLLVTACATFVLYKFKKPQTRWG
jgi:hypothetical protein